MLEITFWAASRDAAVAFLKAVNIADTDEDGNLVSIADVQIHPFRPNETIAIVKTPAVMNGMEVVTPAVMVPGWHGNMRFYGASEATLRKPQPTMNVAGQTIMLPWPDDADIFDKTFILELCAGRAKLPIGPGGIEWKADANDPVPPGYETPTGVRAFDPSLIATRANVWA